MQRFFVSPDLMTEATVTLDGEVAHQISRVLRMRPGDEIALLDGDGGECTVRLTTFGRDLVEGEVVGRNQAEWGEPRAQVRLYLSLLNKPEKFEWALQKCTELGMASITPIEAERSVPKAKDAAGKQDRWSRIIKEAAEQSGRSRLPLLCEASTFEAAVTREGRAAHDSRGSHLALIPTMDTGKSLKEVLRAARTESVSIFIGPEGGFAEREVQMAREVGVQPASLGPRVLRAETAAVAALAVVMYELGEMDASAQEQG